LVTIRIGARGGTSSPTSTRRSIDWGGDRGVGDRFSERRHLRVRGGDTGARSVDLFRPRPGAQPGEILSRRADAIVGAAGASQGHVAPRHRVVSLFAGAGIRLEQSVEAIGIGLRGGELRFGGTRFRLRDGELGVGLTDVLGSRPGAQQAQLRVGLIAFGARSGQRELGVGHIQACDDRSGGDAIALGGRQFKEPAADLRGDVDFGRLNLSGCAHPIRGGFLGAGAHGRCAEEQRGQPRDGWSCHRLGLA
jgi:hypothetical protein